MNIKYKVERLDGSDSVPYEFDLKADAIRLAMELNDSAKLAEAKSNYYVKTVIRK